MNHLPLLLAAVAAALALAAAPASAAEGTDATQAQPIRVQPTFHGLRMPVAAATVAGAAQQAPTKLQVLSRPGPVGVMRGRVNGAGQMEAWCNIEDDHSGAHASVGINRRERQR